MKKKLIQIILFAFVALFVTFGFSCKKLIEIPANPPQKISDHQVFADSADAVSAVTGVYTNFGVARFSFGLSFGTGLITQATGLSGDELNTSNTGDPNITQLAENSLVPSNSLVNSLWSGAYQPAIYQINDCIAGISTSTGLSAGLKNQLLGEVEVVRAFYYFHLVNLFGPVPLVTSTDYKITSTAPRSTVPEIYKQIIADLSDAQKRLTVNYPTYTRARVNSYVASALLAKVYLYQEQWQNAYNMADLVIQSGQFQLEPNLANVFLDGSVEAIWQLPANGSYFGVPEVRTFVPSFTGQIPDYAITNALLNAFELGDMRKSAWLGTTTINGALYYYPYKYKNVASSTIPAEDYMMLRLGEQYLIRGEAAAHLGQYTAALADINTIRARAGLPALTNAARTAIFAAIASERQKELFCEWGNRWYDLKRTGAIDTVLGKEKNNWKSSDALYPVPVSEIQRNPALTQNPGY